MKLLGIDDCFDITYGGDFMGSACKPEREVFDRVLEKLGVAAEEVVFFEDSVKNLRAAHALGMRCVLVDSDTAREEEVIAVGVSGGAGESTSNGASVGSSTSAGTGGSSAVSDLSFLVGVVNTLSDGGVQLKAILPEIFL
jgi:beta-phosphoglucomutase-like phosphatase (HAD superfamily)